MEAIVSRLGIIFVVFCLSLTLSLSACLDIRGAKLIDYTDLPAKNRVGANASKAKIKEAIFQGCLARKWVCQEVGSSLILGKIDVRHHEAQVDITYESGQYSIKYRSSQNLNYDAQKNTIHRNYNNWIDYLRKDIDLALTRN
jgi:hypothetical protein